MDNKLSHYGGEENTGLSQYDESKSRKYDIGVLQDEQSNLQLSKYLEDNSEKLSYYVESKESSILDRIKDLIVSKGKQKESLDSNFEGGELLDRQIAELQVKKTRFESEKKETILTTKQEISREMDMHLENVTSKDFLAKIPQDKRLQYFSDDDLSIDKLNSGKLDFQVSYLLENLNINWDLYKNTTAGNLIPSHINSLIKAGREYTRSSDLEFYDGKNRLVLDRTTKLKVGKFTQEVKHAPDVDILNNDESTTSNALPTNKSVIIETTKEINTQVDIKSTGESISIDETSDSMKDITIDQFLKINQDHRIDYFNNNFATKQSLDDGVVDIIHLDFRGNKDINRNLTAGLLLPTNIKGVTLRGVSYDRQGLSGEFFDKNGKRLAINSGDELIVISLQNKVGKLSKTQSDVNFSQEISNSMGDMTTAEFFKIPLDDRLQYLTKENINNLDISNGVENFTIKYKFNGELNRELFNDTSAGTIMPTTIQTLSEGDRVFYRRNNKEFYDKNGKRLIINDSTKLKIMGEDDGVVSSIDYINIKNVYIGTDYEKLAQISLEKGYDQDTTVELFKEVLGDEVGDITKIERLFVELAKLQSKYLQRGRNNIALESGGRFTLNFLREMINRYARGREDDFIKLGYDKERLKGPEPLNVNKVLSSPYEISNTGTTLCSKTARLNLSKLGVKGFPTGNAIDLTKRLESNGAPTLTGKAIESYLSNIGGNVFDLYPKTENGHRCVAFLGQDKNGNEGFYVLDPYYTQKSTTPVSLSDYMASNSHNFRGGITVSPSKYIV